VDIDSFSDNSHAYSIVYGISGLTTFGRNPILS
jgi:hypothetical protein